MMKFIKPRIVHNPQLLKKAATPLLLQPLSSSSKKLSDLIFLSLCGLVFCLYNIAAGSLASWDEALYAQVAKEMVHSGDYLHLTTMGRDWYVKPPLYMWITAGFYHLFGVNEFAARLCSSLSGVGTVLLTYLVGCRLLGRIPALLGAGILLSSTDFLHYAHMSMMDVTNLFFFTLAVYAYLRASEKASWSHMMWFATGCAFMVKGPVIALFFALVGVHMLWMRDFTLLKRAYFWWGSLIALSVVVPWHWVAYQHNPEMFMRDYIGLHWLSRSLEAIEGHAANYYYYIRTLINKYHPWVVFLPFALVWSLYQARKDRAQRLLLIWSLMILAFFTFVVQTKLKWYILPAYPALSLMIGTLLTLYVKPSFAWCLKLIIVGVLILHIPFSSVLIQDYVPALKSLRPQVDRLLSRGERLHMYNYHEQPALTFYLERESRYVDSLAELDQALKSKLWLITEKRHYEPLAPAFMQRGLVIKYQTSGFEQDLVLLSSS